MLPATFAIEIEDASLTWQDVTEEVQNLTDGTSSDSQIIPTVSITFAADTEETIGPLINPEINRQRARLRITEDGETYVYYLIERHTGSVKNDKRYPSLSGRAWAGLLDNMRRISYEWSEDTLASTVAAQVGHADFDNQGGGYRTDRLAGHPGPRHPGQTLPGQPQGPPGNHQGAGRGLRGSSPASPPTEKFSRFTIGPSGHFPRPPWPRSATPTPCPMSSTAWTSQKTPSASRGEFLEYTRPTLPVVAVQVFPSKMDADGTNTAQAEAIVYGSSGRRVSHTSVVDEAITAGSYTEIPVSGCYSVQGVWLNTGTQEAPGQRRSRHTIRVYRLGHHRPG